MKSTPQFLIEPLDVSKHRREEFVCEVPELVAFLQKRARKEVSAWASACFVIVPINDPGRIAGYYTLSAATIHPTKLPPDLIKRLPKYHEMPATLLGRLARDVTFKGTGIGPMLMRDALHRAWLHASGVGSIAVIVDPKNTAAVSFYASYGFQCLDEHRMFLSMNDVAAWAKNGFI